MQALLRGVPVRAGARAGMGDRLPPPDAAVAGDPGASRGKVSTSAKLLARTDLQGKVATTFAPVVNRMSNVGVARGVMEKVTGIAKERLLPTYAKVRFSKWFRNRRAPPAGVGGATCATVAAVPDLHGRVPGPVDRQGAGRRVRAQSHRVRAAGRPGVLRHAVARRRRRRQVPRARGEERRAARAAGEGGATTSSCPSPRAPTC